MFNQGTYAGSPIFFTESKISMYKFLLVIGVLGMFFVGMVGCRSTKRIRKVIATTAVRKDTAGEAARVAALPARDVHADSMLMIRQALAGIGRNHIDFQTFSAHMHVHYQSSDGKDNEVQAIIKVKKDSLIYLSIIGNLGPVGLEAFRVLITRDSVKILDRLKKVARLRSVSYLKDQVNLPVDFQTVQDILIGNPIFLDTSKVLYYRRETKGISIYSVGAAFSNFLTLNPDYTPQHSKLDDTDPLRARTCDLTYGDYDNSGPAPFSSYRKISVAEKSKVDIEIHFKQFKFNEPLSYSFSIPKNYKRR